ncbi:MAG TPA: VWA domain-containing protein [Burkholderiales bacterium]|nr:VWA domain-containing protein [Burkholderiales bacterium]
MIEPLTRFAAALRAAGVRVGLGDEVDAAAALALVDLLDRGEVHRALRIAFKLSREAWDLYDRLFREYWEGIRAPRHEALERALREARARPQWQWDGERVRLALPQDENDEEPEGDTPGYSAEEMLRRKPIERCSAGEIAALERMLARLVPRLAARRSRRLTPTHGRGHVDLRRSFRHALRSEGDLVRLARRSRALEQPSLVVLYDTSGSMAAYTRLLLAFAFALRRSIRKVEIFAFNTSLVRVTRMISPAEVARTLERLAAGVPDWSGGTRIGACLGEFNARWRDRVVNRHTTVLVVSDGLDHGEAEVLGRAMRELRERARRIVWLNPLAGDARYRPQADGMLAALPFVDHFGAAHNLESLEGLLAHLA